MQSQKLASNENFLSSDRMIIIINNLEIITIAEEVSLLCAEDDNIIRRQFGTH